jgi:hypothetical protein
MIYVAKNRLKKSLKQKIQHTITKNSACRYFKSVGFVDLHFRGFITL